MSLGGPAHESLLSKPHSQQPAQTIELSRGESGIFNILFLKKVFKVIMLFLLWRIAVLLSIRLVLLLNQIQCLVGCLQCELAMQEVCYLFFGNYKKSSKPRMFLSCQITVATML